MTPNIDSLARAAAEEINRVSLAVTGEYAMPTSPITSILKPHFQRACEAAVKEATEDTRNKVNCLTGYIEYMIANPRLSWPHELEAVIKEANEWLDAAMLPLPPAPTKEGA